MLEFGECNGHMNVECYANNVLIATPIVTETENVMVNVMVDFPFNLTIKVSGKNSNTDTLVQDNKLVKDKYVKLKEIYLARYQVNEGVLYNLCQFLPNNESIVQTNYFYCNGVATLKFQATDALRWHLLNNKY